MNRMIKYEQFNELVLFSTEEFRTYISDRQFYWFSSRRKKTL
ncbi:MAG: hypothetical protein ACP5H0_03630 [Caldisericum sp.]